MDIFPFFRHILNNTLKVKSEKQEYIFSVACAFILYDIKVNNIFSKHVKSFIWF